jgi:hypothetical protein
MSRRSPRKIAARRIAVGAAAGHGPRGRVPARARPRACEAPREDRA